MSFHSHSRKSEAIAWTRSLLPTPHPAATDSDRDVHTVPRIQGGRPVWQFAICSAPTSSTLMTVAARPFERCEPIQIVATPGSRASKVRRWLSSRSAFVSSSTTHRGPAPDLGVRRRGKVCSSAFAVVETVPPSTRSGDEVSAPSDPIPCGGRRQYMSEFLTADSGEDVGLGSPVAQCEHDSGAGDGDDEEQGETAGEFAASDHRVQVRCREYQNRGQAEE